jgi:hypothetical protein
MEEHTNSTVKGGDFYTVLRKFITGEFARRIHAMVASSTGLGPENDYAGEDQQQL